MFRDRRRWDGGSIIVRVIYISKERGVELYIV